jgi:hypothetical protein
MLSELIRMQVPFEYFPNIWKMHLDAMFIFFLGLGELSKHSRIVKLCDY